METKSISHDIFFTFIVGNQAAGALPAAAPAGAPGQAQGLVGNLVGGPVNAAVNLGKFPILIAYLLK